MISILITIPTLAHAASTISYVTKDKAKAAFKLAEDGRVAPLLISPNDYPGVIRALRDLQTDIEKVTGIRPAIIFKAPSRASDIVIVGTIGKSPLIDSLIKGGRIHADRVKGEWETYLLETIERPFSNVSRALVIAGSDRRGTIYGIYDLSAKIGVSPWYWWADFR